MTNEQKELLAKYNRVSEDKSQLQIFVQDVILGKIGGSLSGSYATDDDIDLVFGVADVGERTVTSHTLILNDNDVVDEENHMLIFGADAPSPSNYEFDISEESIPDYDPFDVRELADFSILLDCFSKDENDIIINEPVPEITLTFKYNENIYTVIFEEYINYPGEEEAEVFAPPVEFIEGHTIQLSFGAISNLLTGDLELDWVEVRIVNSK